MKEGVKFKFNWDEGNLEHVLRHKTDKSRNNTVEEVESIFDDPNLCIGYDELHSIKEDRFYAFGIGKQGIVKYVVYTERNGKIRPITCYPADDNLKALYYERLRETSKGANETRSGGGTEEFDPQEGG